MIKEKNISFFLKKLSSEEIASFMRLNDDDFFEKLSERIDIDEYSKKLQNKALHFTIYETNQLIGFSPCYFNHKMKGVGYISSLTITYGYRTFGLGSYLLNEIKKYANSNSFYTIMVSIHIDNQISSGFYKKNSFNIFEENKEKSIAILKYYKE